MQNVHHESEPKQVPIKKDLRRLSAAVPTAKDKILHSKPWQYGVTFDATRKFRVVAERMRRLARTLARFDRSGACRAIFPAVNTILARLRETELNYPEGQRFKWSRRTVFIYLARLEAARIATASGLSTYHGTRCRELHPDLLLSVPRESCTPTRRESCTQKILRSKNLHLSGNRRIETREPAADDAASSAPAALPKSSNSKTQTTPSCSGNGQSKARTAADPPAPWTVQQLREPSIAIELLNILAIRYPEGVAYPERWPMEMLVWALRATEGDPDCEREIFRPGRYVHACIDNFLTSFPDWQREVILRRFHDLPGVRFDSSRWVLAARAPASSPAPAPASPAPPIVRSPKAIEKACGSGELERNLERAQEKVESEWDKALRYREWYAAKLVAHENSSKKLRTSESVRLLSPKEIEIRKQDQREKLASAHPEWSAAVSPLASDRRQ